MYTCALNEGDFFRIYNPQRGGSVGNDGAVFFKANRYRQRGHRIGGIFGSILRKVMPFLTKHVLPATKEAIKNVAVHVLDGKKGFKQSLSQHGVTALKNVGRSILSQSGSGVGKKRTLHSSSKRSSKKLKKTPDKSKKKKIVKR